MIVKQELKTTAEMAAWYDSAFTRMGGVWHTSPEEWEAHLDRAGVAGGTLLDVGCGDGSFLIAAAKRCNFTIGMDISLIAVDWALEKGVLAYRWTIEDGALWASSLSPRYDWIFSLGSLEHVIDIDKALDNIHALLKPDGKWYFYLPSEKWTHFDQPGERCATIEEWSELFAQHGLFAADSWTNNDCVAIWGGKR